MGRIERWYELYDKRLGGIYEYSNFGRVRVATELPVLRGRKKGDIIRPTLNGIYSLKALDNKFVQYTPNRLMLMTGVPLDEEALDMDGEEWKEWKKGVFVSQYGRAKKDDKLLPIRVTRGKGHRAYINKNEYIDMMQALCRLFFGVDKAVMKLEGDLCTDNISFRNPNRSTEIKKGEFSKGYANGWMFVYTEGFNRSNNHQSLLYLAKTIKRKMAFLEEADILPVYMEAIIRDYIYETEYIYQEGEFGQHKPFSLKITEYENGAMKFNVNWKGKLAFYILEPVSHGIERGYTVMSWKDVQKAHHEGALKDVVSFRRRITDESTEKTNRTKVSVFRTVSASSMGTGWTLMCDEMQCEKMDYYLSAIIAYIKALLNGSYAQTKPAIMLSRIKEYLSLLSRFYSSRVVLMSLENPPKRELDHGYKIILKIYSSREVQRPLAILMSPSPGFGFAWMQDSKRGRDIVIGDMVLPDNIEAVSRFDDMVKKCCRDRKKGYTFSGFK